MPKLDTVDTLIQFTERQKLTFWGLSGFQENMNKRKHNRQFSSRLKFLKKDLKKYPCLLCTDAVLWPTQKHFKHPLLLLLREMMWLPLLPARPPPARTEVTRGNGSLRREKAGLATTTTQGKGKGRQPGCKAIPLPFTPLSVGSRQAYSHRCSRAETHAACSSLGLHLS